MISHSTIGTNNLDSAEFFFNALLPLVSGRQYLKTDRSIFYNFENGGSGLAIYKPFDEKVASCGNGSMIAFSVEGEDKVTEVYNKALALGGSNEGEPGVRGNGVYFGAYFRDLDGNKFAVFCQLAAVNA